ncbi:Transcription initiation factor IIA subunit 1 [Blomia tropicalis]|nr:Transcription initiation factor IIA subunit 1 [Blomia tropicalis]
MSNGTFQFGRPYQGNGIRVDHTKVSSRITNGNVNSGQCFTPIRYLMKRMPFTNNGSPTRRVLPNFKVVHMGDQYSGSRPTLPVQPSPGSIYYNGSGRSFDRLDAFLKPRPPHSRDIVPKFYKSVIDDVVSNIRETFLDDGVDEQVIQELRALWERKISESRAIEHATNVASTSASTTGSSNSSTNNKSSTNNSNSQSSSKNKSQAGGQTSVITSNPNHVKNGPNSANNSSTNSNNTSNNNTVSAANTTNSNNNSNQTITTNNPIRVKEEIEEQDDQQTRGRPNVSSQPLPTNVVLPPTSSPMIANGSMVQVGGNHLTQPGPGNNILRASAIVTNPSGGPGLSVPTSTPQLLQVQLANQARLHPLQQQQQHQQTQQLSTGSKRPNIVTLIPSTSSTSFSSPMMASSSSGGGNIAISSSSNTNNSKHNGDGNFGSNFISKIVSSNNMSISAPNSSNTIAPLHGHKKRILSTAFAERNSALNGSPNGTDNLTSLAEVAIRSGHALPTSYSSNLQQSSELRMAQSAQRLQELRSRSAFLEHAGLQSMSHDQQIMFGSGAGNSSGGANVKQEVKYPVMSHSGQKIVLVPNSSGQYVMAAPGAQYVLTPEILNQLNLQGGILTAGHTGQPTVLHGPSVTNTIQFATAPRGTAPTIQQVRTMGGLMPTIAVPQITRSRNKWKFHFKDGIMNLQGKDYVFQKAVGDAEW